METIYIVTHWWDGDAVLGEPVACFTSLESANAYCLDFVRGMVASGDWDEIEDQSTDELAAWAWERGHQNESAFVTRLEVRE